MNRQEFLSQLARLLEDIPESERQEALDYYSSYFDDAGPENEARVIQELGGDPQKAAASLKAEFHSAQTGRKDYGEYTERGYRDTRIPYEGQMPQPVPGQEKEAQNRWDFPGGDFRHKKSMKGLIAILILIATSPIWLGLAGGLIGLVFSLLGTVLSLLAGLAATVVGLLASGIALAVSGILKCVTQPALGLLAAGLGLLTLSVDALLMILFIWLAARPFPQLIRWCWRCFSRFFQWCKGKWKRIIF